MHYLYRYVCIFKVFSIYVYGKLSATKNLFIFIYLKSINTKDTMLVYRPGYFTVHPPPRLQVDQNFLTQKIVADPKMRCHQKSFGIWRVTEAILGQKTCFFSKNIFWKKFIINLTIFLIFRYAFYRY